MKTEADLSIIIVSYNTRDMTRRCLESVYKHSAGISCQIFVVDNASSDGSADMVKVDFPCVNLIRLEKNMGFAAGNNQGIRNASGRYVLLLNSDAFISEGVLESTINYMDTNPNVGILGCRLTNPDASPQPSARMLPSPLNKFFVITGLSSRFPKSRIFGRVDFSWWDHSQPRRVGWVVGAYFLIRSDTIADIGLLDERYFLYFEEIDYCKAAQESGWDVIFYPYARVIHLGGQSAERTDKEISSKGRQLLNYRIESEFRYYRKWYGLTLVLISAGIELLWKGAVFLKNSLIRSPGALRKRTEALVTARIILSTLITDSFGKGK
ncbi:MAG: glycosyltransferase family 2 protein [Deltaproteobacteria bacterium]|nr:glycosyltransferase family 2 protein [Deltaproteobacteria bacterium]